MNETGENHCHVEELLRIIAGRWKVVLIRELEAGPRRHGELMRRMKGITQKMLTQRLRELEADGIASREYLMEGRVKVAEYALTEWGRRVMQIVMQIHHWTIDHAEHFPRVRREPRPARPQEATHAAGTALA